ncbi:MAG: SMEK domain-containing protein [Lewinellaceae bacterium]|nr:SMEK domain-containing protein [Lewinellaceae bacterium]
MNRSTYFDYIEDKINHLATRIISRGKLNILNLNIHSENFYARFVNELYGWNLSNANEDNQNTEAIDLIDDEKKLIVQVSSTATKDKIERSLEKPLIVSKKGYNFKFISIAKDADSLFGKSYKNPHGCSFDSNSDIIDKNKILKRVFNCGIDEQRKIYELIEKELGQPEEKAKLESTIADLINILSADDLHTGDSSINIDPFEIEDKISCNSLIASKSIIQECSIYSPKVDKKYEIFDKEGVNKSLSVLRTITRIYVNERVKGGSSDTIFLNTIDEIVKLAKNSTNFMPISFELLQTTAEIIVVDAFLRCKIFENPTQSYASA